MEGAEWIAAIIIGGITAWLAQMVIRSQMGSDIAGDKIADPASRLDAHHAEGCAGDGCTRDAKHNIRIIIGRAIRG